MINKAESVLETFWAEFLKLHPDNHHKQLPEAFYFCDNEKDANECADLVIKNIKRATATSLWWFKKYAHPLPEVGDQAIVTDWHGNPKAIIETVKVTPTPFNEVTPELAAIEGEGDKSLEYWRKVHRAYYTREMEPYGVEFDENMPIIFEQFRTIFVAENA